MSTQLEKYDSWLSFFRSVFVGKKIVLMINDVCVNDFIFNPYPSSHDFCRLLSLLPMFQDSL